MVLFAANPTGAALYAQGSTWTAVWDSTDDAVALPPLPGPVASLALGPATALAALTDGALHAARIGAAQTPRQWALDVPAVDHAAVLHETDAAVVFAVATCGHPLRVYSARWPPTRPPERLWTGRGACGPVTALAACPVTGAVAVVDSAPDGQRLLWWPSLLQADARPQGIQYEAAAGTAPRATPLGVSVAPTVCGVHALGGALTSSATFAAPHHGRPVLVTTHRRPQGAATVARVWCCDASGAAVELSSSVHHAAMARGVPGAPASVCAVTPEGDVSIGTAADAAPTATGLRGATAVQPVAPAVLGRHRVLLGTPLGAFVASFHAGDTRAHLACLGSAVGRGVATALPVPQGFAVTDGSGGVALWRVGPGVEASVAWVGSSAAGDAPPQLATDGLVVVRQCGQRSEAWALETGDAAAVPLWHAHPEAVACADGVVAVLTAEAAHVTKAGHTVAPCPAADLVPPRHRCLALHCAALSAEDDVLLCAATGDAAGNVGVSAAVWQSEAWAVHEAPVTAPTGVTGPPAHAAFTQHIPAAPLLCLAWPTAVCVVGALTGGTLCTVTPTDGAVVRTVCWVGRACVAALCNGAVTATAACHALHETTDAEAAVGSCVVVGDEWHAAELAPARPSNAEVSESRALLCAAGRRTDVVWVLDGGHARGLVLPHSHRSAPSCAPDYHPEVLWALACRGAWPAVSSVARAIIAAADGEDGVVRPPPLSILGAAALEEAVDPMSLLDADAVAGAEEAVASVALPGLDHRAQLEVASFLAAVRSCAQAGALDAAATRALLSFFSRGTAARLGYPAPMPASAGLWAAVSECHTTMLQAFAAALTTPHPNRVTRQLAWSWEELRQWRVGVWARSIADLRRTMEAFVKELFTATRDPRAVALWYVAMHKRTTLAGLCQAVREPKLGAFFRRDFGEEKHREAASSNAFVSVGKGNVAFALAFFLLAGDWKTGAEVVLQRTGDWVLAFTALRLWCDDDKAVLSAFVDTAVLPREGLKLSPFDRALLLWRCDRQEEAAQALWRSRDPDAAQVLQYCAAHVPALMRRSQNAVLPVHVARRHALALAARHIDAGASLATLAKGRFVAPTADAAQEEAPAAPAPAPAIEADHAAGTVMFFGDDSFGMSSDDDAPAPAAAAPVAGPTSTAVADPDSAAQAAVLEAAVAGCVHHAAVGVIAERAARGATADNAAEVAAHTGAVLPVVATSAGVDWGSVRRSFLDRSAAVPLVDAAVRQEALTVAPAHVASVRPAMCVAVLVAAVADAVRASAPASLLAVLHDGVRLLQTPAGAPAPGTVLAAVVAAAETLTAQSPLTVDGTTPPAAVAALVALAAMQAATVLIPAALVAAAAAHPHSAALSDFVRFGAAWLATEAFRLLVQHRAVAGPGGPLGLPDVPLAVPDIAVRGALLLPTAALPVGASWVMPRPHLPAPVDPAAVARWVAGFPPGTPGRRLATLLADDAAGLRAWCAALPGAEASDAGLRGLAKAETLLSPPHLVMNARVPVRGVGAAQPLHVAAPVHAVLVATEVGLKVALPSARGDGAAAPTARGVPAKGGPESLLGLATGADGADPALYVAAEASCLSVHLLGDGARRAVLMHPSFLHRDGPATALALSHGAASLAALLPGSVVCLWAIPAVLPAPPTEPTMCSRVMDRPLGLAFAHGPGDPRLVCVGVDGGRGIFTVLHGATGVPVVVGAALGLDTADILSGVACLAVPGTAAALVLTSASAAVVDADRGTCGAFREVEGLPGPLAHAAVVGGGRLVAVATESTPAAPSTVALLLLSELVGGSGPVRPLAAHTMDGPNGAAVTALGVAPGAVLAGFRDGAVAELRVNV